MRTVADWARRNRVLFLLFFGLFFTYAALTPGTIQGMGYAGEDMKAADSLLAILHAWLTGQPAPAMALARNGPVPLIIDLPFQALGKRVISEDFVLSFEPIVETALLGVILFIWLRKFTTPAFALFLTLTAAFGTMLWPYAYIGLETKQSLFFLLAGFLAIEGRPIRSFGQAVAFGICCTFALGSKANGLMLLPALAYAGYLQFRAQFRDDRRRGLTLIFTVLAIMGAVLIPAMQIKARYWAAIGTTTWGRFRDLMVDSVFKVVGNAVGMFGSPAKGLLLYAPIVVLSLYAVPAAWRQRRELTIFILLAVGGLVGGFAINIYYADETWGPRYLHVCVPLLVLLIGATRERFEWRRDAIMIPLAAYGFMVSFLGAFYYYGTMHLATMRESQNSIAELLGDQTWNQIAFHARLFTAWWHFPPGSNVPWTPWNYVWQHWIWSAPADAPPVRTLNLMDYAQPQSLLIRAWHQPLAPPMGAVWNALLVSALLGPCLLLATSLLTGRSAPVNSELSRHR